MTRICAAAGFEPEPGKLRNGEPASRRLTVACLNVREGAWLLGVASGTVRLLVRQAGSFKLQGFSFKGGGTDGTHGTDGRKQPRGETKEG